MALFPLKLGPGFFRPGTIYEAKGRWFTGTLVRWFESVMQPVGGWEKLQAGGSDISVAVAARGAHTWRDNSDEPHLALGTYLKLFVWVSGALTDVTPTSFTTSAAVLDAVQSSGVYGNGNYGDGPYGTGGSAASVIVEANTWQMDNHGEDLICTSFGDGKIYTQSGSSQAVVLANAPTNVRGVVVTPEGFVVALGNGNIDTTGDRRLVAWADVDDRTLWAPAPDNQAGELPLPGAGEIMAGRRTRNETLIWTDVDLFAMRYIGGQFVYQIPQVGSNCGAISRRAMAVVDSQAIWMGHNGFYTYNGFVEDLPSTVGDFIFNDINRVQRSKIWAEIRSAFGEITWHYPSGSSLECDRYVTFNYREGIWYTGFLERTTGADQGALQSPVSTDASGAVYEHEIVNGTYKDPADVALQPFAESGPIEIGQGDQTMLIQEYIPDEITLGDLDVTIFSSLLPMANDDATIPDEVESAVFTAAARTSARVLARQVRLKIAQKAGRTNWRFGTMRLNVVPSGQR